MIRRQVWFALTVALLFPVVAGAFPQVPENTAPNPPGLVRPKHLGGEWPHLNIDEKLYSLRYTDLRGHYGEWSKEHTDVRTSTYPGLEEQFGITAYKLLPPDYYGRLESPDYHQPFTELSANISGSTGLIDMPSAFTQKKGVWLASLGFSSSGADSEYFTSLYQEFDATDIRASVTYGYRDDTELTATMSVLDRDFDYVNSAQRDTSGRIFFGLGGKLSFATVEDKYQIAVGGMFNFFSDEERDIMRMIDYHSMSNLYLVASTDTHRFNAHVMYRFVSYDWRSNSLAPTAQIGNVASTGFGPAEDHWGELGFALEYKVPKTKIRVLTEMTSTGPLDFIGRKDKSFNFGLASNTPGGDYKIYSRMLNHDDFTEFGLMSTFHF